jgi:hypothetical protein
MKQNIIIIITIIIIIQCSPLIDHSLLANT